MRRGISLALRSGVGGNLFLHATPLLWRQLNSVDDDDDFALAMKFKCETEIQYVTTGLQAAVSGRGVVGSGTQKGRSADVLPVMLDFMYNSSGNNKQ